MLTIFLILFPLSSYKVNANKGKDKRMVRGRLDRNNVCFANNINGKDY